MKKEEKEQAIKEKIQELEGVSLERIKRARRILSGALQDNLKAKDGYSSAEIVMALLAEAYAIEHQMLSVDTEVLARNIVESKNKDNDGQDNA